MSVEIELSRVWRAISRFWWIGVASMVVFALLLGGIQTLPEDEYSASTSLLVVPEQISGVTIVDGGGSLQTYMALAESWPVLQRVNIDLDLDYELHALQDKISVRSLPGTQIIVITATDSDPEMAAAISTTVAQSLEAQVNELTIGKLQDKLTSLEYESGQLELRMTSMDAEIAGLDSSEGELSNEDQRRRDQLNTERLQVAQTKSDIDSEIRSVRANIGVAQPVVVVSDPAQVPGAPDGIPTSIAVVGGAALGAFLGGILMLFLEFRSSVVRDREHLEELTGEPVLATVKAKQIASEESAASRLLAAKIVGRTRQLDSDTVAIIMPHTGQRMEALLEAVKLQSGSQNLNVMEVPAVLENGVDVHMLPQGVGALVIIQEGKTTEAAVREISGLLNALDVGVLGTILIR